jgi:succinyl-diaminopimelate desuccinylase
VNTEQRVLAEIDRRADELLALAGELIRTPSENPPGDVTEVAALVTSRLPGSTTHDAGDGRVNVVARSGEEADRHLVLCGHIDTVPVGDPNRWSFSPFAGDVIDGYLRGRGASDMKAGVAAAMMAYLVLSGEPLSGRLTFAAVADEETGGPRGAKWLFEQGLLAGATGAIIAEPSGRAHPTIGQKGSNWFRLTIDGEPGHGSLQPMSGVSANLLAAKAILALQGLWDMKPDPPDEARELIAISQRNAEPHQAPAFDHVTVNIGRIQGGTATNVVADRCVVDVDTRVPIGLSRAEVLAEVRRLLDEAGVPGQIEPTGFRSEPNWTSPDDPVVTELVGTLRELVDQEAHGVLQWASSDARVFRTNGVPVLQYGPAYLPTIHGLDERAPAEDVITAAKVYALTALRYLGKEASC